MKKDGYMIIEKMAIFLAGRSTGKSIPMFSHKVDKPKDIEEKIKKLRTEGSLLKRL